MTKIGDKKRKNELFYGFKPKYKKMAETIMSILTMGNK